MTGRTPSRSTRLIVPVLALTLAEPGIANLDFAVHKTVVLHETRSLEFRTEVFNIFNHTQFLNPDGNVTDGSAFGLVTSARDPRLIQFALQLIF